jgi:hypothetical protein
MSRTFEHAWRPFHSGAAADAAALAALERALGVALPADYRSFLSKCNGGSLRPFAFDLRIPGWTFDETVHAVDYFYEAGEIAQRSQVDLAPARRNIPPGRIAIGDTVSELALTLDVTPARHGSVDVWVFDSFNTWGAGANRIVVPLADSFTAFLHMLHDSPDVYSSFWADFDGEGGKAHLLELP